ncbi:MAG: MFS transporter [Gammaproteobacteria bacterium AqS3]|nr:MFS transporter [Gammaproteobacteria bacterium AqS3]
MEDEAKNPAPERERPAPLYSGYVLGLLGLTYAFSMMDRQIVTILLGDLKAEFALSDTQLGLLSGTAFALFYSTLAIPIARLADRHNRITIISISMTLWSIATAVCAFVGNFWQLFLGRMAVGIGEAGGLSPAHSVLSDYFDERRRMLAISLFSLCGTFGVMLGTAMGGYVSQEYGWRTAFLVAGLPGIAVALLLKLTVREPRRGAMDSTTAAAAEAPSEKEPFAQAVLGLMRNRLYLQVLIAHTLVIFVAYALVSWLPELMLRTYEVSKAEVGVVIGLTFFVGGGGGMLIGGLLAMYFSKHDARWQLRIPALGLLAALPLFWLAFNAETIHGASVLFAGAMMLGTLQHGPSLAVVQNCVPPHRRATAAAFNFFSSNLFGLGLGPLAVGSLSDLGASTYGGSSLAVALGACVLLNIPALIIFLRASNDLGKAAKAEQGS